VALLVMGVRNHPLFAAPPPPQAVAETGHSIHDTQSIVRIEQLQINVPVPAAERRIINCAAAYVDCANADLFGPCCLNK
jgi:hypothetical protein